MKRKIIAYIVSVLAIGGLFTATLFIDHRDYNMADKQQNIKRVVILGDSIMCNDIESESISTLFEAQSGFEVEDLSVGGTCATSLNKDGQIDYYMDMLNFLNITSFILTGNLSSIYDDSATLEMNSPTCVLKMQAVVNDDFNDVDYLILNYGVNDALQGVLARSDDPYDTDTFGGCMRKGIEEIHEKYPNLHIIVNGMNYYYDVRPNGRKAVFDAVNDCYLEAYNAEMAQIASEYDNVFYFDIADKLKIDSSNASTYLCDGVHYSFEGKKLYVEYLIEFVNKQNEN